MQALPCVQVRDLPPSASFYSAVTQPLGLRFISANAGSIVFGNSDPAFEVKACADRPRPTRIVLAASSPSAVSAFHAAARRANPNGNSQIHLKENDGPNGESRASATDLEGNTVEIVYAGSNAGYGQSTTKQVTRILNWGLDGASSVTGAARSVAGSAAPLRPGLATLQPQPAEDDTYRIIRRSFTTSTFESAAPPQEGSKGLSAGAVFGVLGAVAAGVAVGAGISYAFSKKERDRAPRQEFAESPFQRRASYQGPQPDQQQPRYVELERTVEKVRYPEQYPRPGSNEYARPAYTTRPSQTDIPPVEELDDPASRPSSSPRTRDRSVEPTPEPLLITETEHKSNVGSQAPMPPPPPPPPPPMMVVEDEDRSQSKSKDKDTNPKSQLHAELFKRRKPQPPSEAPPKASDTRSHVSSRSKHDDDDRRSHRSSRSKHDDEDRRSHRSSRPKLDDDGHRSHRSSRSKHDDDDRRSHVSSRSKHKHDDDDRRSHAGSRHTTVRRSRDTEAETFVSARSEKTTTTLRPSKSRPETPSRVPSYVSAREIPTPPEEDWRNPTDDDDKASIAPSESISCIEERPKPHARDLPFLQTRERIIIQ
ncbi:putative cystathionine gamma-synthase protein [Rosellinia necatrix]|uniref:Putative cystathionine gamma-synthase protein n=1 Tax=Rosellinia necatrix TaxID=77044 RepID=A0A1W2TN98_ROSNE|nr:putative cystathionine gamma-synthase protein [Rosellinia necatrix]